MSHIYASLTQAVRANTHHSDDMVPPLDGVSVHTYTAGYLLATEANPDTLRAWLPEALAHDSNGYLAAAIARNPRAHRTVIDELLHATNPNTAVLTQIASRSDLTDEHVRTLLAAGHPHVYAALAKNEHIDEHHRAHAALRLT